MNGGSKDGAAEPAPARSGKPRVWALLGARRGDNNQVLALADALGLKYERKPLRYTPLRLVPARLLGASTASLDRPSRQSLQGSPPDLVIAIGHRSAPVVRWLKARGRRTIAVQLGNPRVPPQAFDLVVTTPQYPVPDAPNVLRFPVVITRPAGVEQTAQANISDSPLPRRLLIVGGATTSWRLDLAAVVDALRVLCEAANHDGGSVWVATSPRTSRDVLKALTQVAGTMDVGPLIFTPADQPAFPQLLGTADMLFVTADSVAMTSEALMTGKPVGLIAVRQTLAGKIWFAVWDRLRPHQTAFPRDLRRFWAALRTEGWSGSVEQPRSLALSDVATRVGDRIRRLLEAQGFSL